MANPLTWRNVEAPDFRGSLDGIRISANAFDRAFSGLSDGLGKFQDYRQDQADAALALAAQRFGSPEALRQAQMSGALLTGIDPSLVRPTALAGVDKRVNNLLDQATATQALNTAQQIDPFRIQSAGLGVDKQRSDIAFDAAYNPIRLQGAQADVAGKLISNSSNALGLRLDQDTYGDKVTSSRQGVERGALSNEEARFKLDTAKTNWSEGRSIDVLGAKLLSESLTPPDLYAMLQSPQFKNQPPNVQAALTQRAQEISPGLFGPGGGMPVAGTGSRASAAIAGAAGASAGTNGPRAPTPFMSLVPFAETRDYVPKVLARAGDLTGLTNEEKAERLMPHLVQQESSGDAGAVSRAGARGLTQLMPATARELEKKLGMSPGETDRNPEANRRAGQAYLVQMFNEFDGDPEKALAGYNAGPNRVKEWLANSPESVRTASTTLQSGARQAASEIGTQRQQNQAVGILADYAEAAADTKRTPGMAVDALTNEKDGPYRGAARSRVLNDLNEIVAMGGTGPNGPRIPYSLAQKFLERHQKGDGMVGRGVSNIVGSPQIVPDMDAIKKEVQSYLQGDITKAANADAGMGAIQEKLTTASAALDQANNDYRNAAQRGMTDRLPYYRSQVAAAQAALQALTKAQREDATLTTAWVPPPNASAAPIVATPPAVASLPAMGGGSFSGPAAQERLRRELERLNQRR